MQAVNGYRKVSLRRRVEPHDRAGQKSEEPSGRRKLTCRNSPRRVNCVYCVNPVNRVYAVYTVYAVNRVYWVYTVYTVYRVH